MLILVMVMVMVMVMLHPRISLAVLEVDLAWVGRLLNHVTQLPCLQTHVREAVREALEGEA